jgi:anti-sigma regulatory factor (Ser/Thr protein kinase)
VGTQRRDLCAHYVVFGPRSPRQARELVRRAASDAHWDGDVEGAVLSASEIVTNAICHAGCVRWLDVAADDHTLRVEAADSSDEPVEQVPVGPESISGRGLAIVEQLSDRWGVRPDGDGKTVWFEMSSLRPAAGL